MMTRSGWCSAFSSRDAQIDHRELKRHPHLVGGKTDPGRGVHGFHHVFDQTVDGIVDMLDAGGFLPEHGVGILPYFTDVPYIIFNMIYF